MVMKRKSRRILLSVCGVLFVLAGIFLLADLNKPAGQDISTESEGGSLLSTKEGITRSDGHVEVNFLADRYTAEERAEQTTLVVYGEVVYIHQPVVVLSADGRMGVVTDVDIIPEKVYRGECGEEITLRLSGGVLEGKMFDGQLSPELLLHEKYLFFLYRSDKGMGVYAKGEQYYLAGPEQGVFVPDEEGTAFVNFWNESFTAEELTALFERVNETIPVDENKRYREAQENIRGNLENGVITREAYEEDMANLERYAEEITPEEAEEIARQNEAEKEKLRQMLSQEE